MTLRFTRAVVTGGAGFLGSHVCAALAADGTAVACLDNFATGRPGNVAALAGQPGFQLIRRDITAGAWVPGHVDLVMHLASAASPADYLRMPVETLRAGGEGTLNALELARRKRARFVLASTSEVYGDPLEHPQPESYWGNVNPVGPRSVYDEAKRYAEAAVTAYRAAHGVDAGIVRIFNCYGPGLRPDDGRAIPTFIRQALAGQPLTVTGDGRQTRSVCYADDTVRGLLLFAASGHPGPMNIGNPDEMTMRDLAVLIRELAGSRSPVVSTSRPADDPQVRCPDITLAREVLGWRPEIPAREGLRRTIRWFSCELAQAGSEPA